MSNAIFIKESNLQHEEVVYVKGPENSVQRVNASLSPRYSLFKQIFTDILLPQGYPDSVCEDYTTYQLWDTLQAFCSTITNTLSTRAVLKGFGVGDNTASAVSAAITWILKDGIGMIARILFAWMSGTRLDADCKKWRLFADFINDVAVCIEIFLLPLYQNSALLILCFSTSLKAIVGVAGGATRAAITEHQAIKHNSADVSAKDGSQETCVNLLASVVGIMFLNFYGDSSETVCEMIILLTLMHLFANYKAVTSLNFNKFNNERLNYVIKKYLLYEDIPSPEDTNMDESVILGTGISSRGLCGYDIKLGHSLEKLVKYDQIYPFELKLVTHLYRGRKYLIIVSEKCQEIYVLLDKNHSCSELLEAYFHAILQGITASFVMKRTPAYIDSCTSSIMSKILKVIEPNLNDIKDRKRVDADVTIQIDSIAAKNVSYFIKTLTETGWNTDNCYLYVGDWRASWKETLSSVSDENMY